MRRTKPFDAEDLPITEETHEVLLRGLAQAQCLETGVSYLSLHRRFHGGIAELQFRDELAF